MIDRLRLAEVAALSMLTLAALGCDDTDEAPPEEPAGYTIEPPPLADRPIDSLLAGDFRLFGDYRGVFGRAQLVRHYDGTTSVHVYADGLAPNASYGAHVHALPCDISQGGGHYKIDPTVEDIVPENEIWPDFTTDDAGVGVGWVTVDHIARGDAQSVVLHDPMNDNAKMACADLRAPEYRDWSARGTFAPFAYASEADGPIGGTATLSVSPDGTTIELAVTGLRADQQYRTHLHALPCHVSDAGPHYKIDPTIAETVPENELWPDLAPGPDGAATSTLTSSHPVRATAQSIVIHRVAGDEAPKVACATLVRADYGPLVLEGRGALMPAAIERGYGGMQVEASLTRALDGTTRGLVAVQGARAAQVYPVHLHAYSCAVAAGGGHYKLDPSIADVLPDNEMWLDFRTDASGNGVQSVQIDHLARADAVSMVVHDYVEDGARLACVDLN